MDGFLSSPAAGWVTSAPKNITGSVLRKDGLQINKIVKQKSDLCYYLSKLTILLHLDTQDVHNMIVMYTHYKM